MSSMLLGKRKRYTIPHSTKLRRGRIEDDIIIWKPRQTNRELNFKDLYVIQNFLSDSTIDSSIRTTVGIVWGYITLLQPLMDQESAALVLSYVKELPFAWSKFDPDRCFYVFNNASFQVFGRKENGGKMGRRFFDDDRYLADNIKMLVAWMRTWMCLHPDGYLYYLYWFCIYNIMLLFRSLRMCGQSSSIRGRWNTADPELLDVLAANPSDFHPYFVGPIQQPPWVNLVKVSNIQAFTTKRGIMYDNRIDYLTTFQVVIDVSHWRKKTKNDWKPCVTKTYVTMYFDSD